MNKLRFEQFSVLTAPYLHHTLEYALDSVAGNGFKNVEIWAASPHYCLDDCGESDLLREKRLTEIRRMLKERGLRLSAFYPEQHRQYPYNIASPNEYIRKYSIAHMEKYIEDAVTLGTDKMILCPGWEFLDQQSADNRKRAVESIQMISDRASAAGVLILLEEMESIHSLFTDNLEKLSKLIRDAGSDNIKVCFNSYMAAQNEECYNDYIHEFGQVSYIHLSDSNSEGYTAFGEGTQDLTALLQSFIDRDYEGTISVSLWGGGFYKDPDRQLRKTTDFLRYCDLVGRTIPE